MNIPAIYFLWAILPLLIGVVGSWLFYRLKQKAIKKDFESTKNLLQYEIDHARERAREVEVQYVRQAEKREDEFYRRTAEIKEELERVRGIKERSQMELERRNTEYAALREKFDSQKQDLENLQEKFQNAFENLANSILEKKSEKFTDLNKTNIEGLLKPLKEKISSFEEKVAHSEKESVKRHVKLEEQLNYLNEQNLKISEEAVNLTRALKGNAKTQGNWGEMILERVLERSGLMKGKEYTVQDSFATESGRRLQPDVIVHLPRNRKMIIDAKVSLTAYERYVNEPEEDSRNRNLKEHLNSIQTHIHTLSEKNYRQIYDRESPDFVLLFIPIEAAFAVASNAYPQLYGEAFDKHIILVTPTTLLAVLGTINSMWQSEKQTQNAVEIASRAGKLYDTFVNLTEELEKLGRQIGTVRTTYDSAMKKLTGRGNLIRRVEQLRALGAKTAKQIDSRYLKAAEEEE